MNTTKWRVIIRMSFDQDKGSKLRNPISKCLGECGIRLTKTMGTWEGAAVSRQEAAQQLAKVFGLLADPSQVRPRRSTQLDHLWIYIDRTPAA